MALVTDVLAGTATASGYKNQLQIVATDHTTASFETGTGTLFAGTPLYFNGTNYARFDSASDIAAFVWPDDVVLDDTNNATGEIMTKGEVFKFSEIEALVDVADRVALKAKCKSGALAKGIVVRGIANINQ